ncbi:hypothetical protein M2G99_20960 [Vibrio vulnificus]|nr:hypothetical protein [Vibrio vulnificus]MCU8225557.1 hypothetical protein [Vibrio vulnificus]MCU8273766.1 hypothetical protein [Vibrio vulnificus]
MVCGKLVYAALTP